MHGLEAWQRLCVSIVFLKMVSVSPLGELTPGVGWMVHCGGLCTHGAAALLLVLLGANVPKYCLIGRGNRKPG